MDNNAEFRLARTVFLLLATLLGGWLVWDAAAYRLVTYSLFADYWEHTAALTEWMRDLWAPGNPHLADGSSSARYIPHFLVLAVLGREFGLDAIQLMALSAVVNYLLVALGTYLFCTAYFRHPWAPAIGLLVFFTGWGVPWIWSNVYELRSFFMVASYPSTFVFGLSLLAFALTLAFIRGRVGLFTGFLGLLLLAALMFVSHALTGVFAIVGCCLLALLVRDCPLSLRLLILMATAAGAALTQAWPWFPVWDVVLVQEDVLDDRVWQRFEGVDAMLERARSGAWKHLFFDPQQVLIALGPALLGVPLCLWLLLRRSHGFIVVGALLMLLPLVANVFYQIALAHRFLLYAVFFFHLAIIWVVLLLFDEWRAAQRQRAPVPAMLRLGLYGTVTVFVLAIVGHVALLLGDYRGVHLRYDLQVVDKRAALPPGMSTVDLYRELTAELPESAVVIGNARLTWPLPTFRGKAVSLPPNHENSLVPDQYERVAAEQAFLAPETPAAERLSIARRYGATHVLINERTTVPELTNWLIDNTTTLAKVERYWLLTINPPEPPARRR